MCKFLQKLKYVEGLSGREKYFREVAELINLVFMVDTLSKCIFWGTLFLNYTALQKTLPILQFNMYGFIFDLSLFVNISFYVPNDWSQPRFCISNSNSNVFLYHVYAYINNYNIQIGFLLYNKDDNICIAQLKLFLFSLYIKFKLF